MSNGETSRRSILGSAAIGLAAAAAPGMARVQSTEPSATGPAPSLRDPRTVYTRTPFPEQRQTWPALASKMTPAPIMASRAIAAAAS